jgi:formyl-CoA transferase
MPSWPVRINGKPPKVKSSPILGEHTDNVLSGWLGMSADQIAKLKADKVAGA